MNTFLGNKRILATLLAICMMFSVLPVSADTQSLQPMGGIMPMSINPEHAYVVGENSYATLGEALDAVPSGGTGTIKVMYTVTHTSPVVISNKNVTFELVEGSLTIDAPTGTALTVQNGSVVTLTGSKTLDVKGLTGGVYADKATVTVGNATSTSGTGAYALYGGDITVLGDARGYSPGAFAYGAGSIITVVGDAMSNGAGANAVIAYSGGRVVAKNVIATGANSYGVNASGSGSTVLITQNVQGVWGGVWAETGGTITIDGTITATNYLRIGSSTKTLDQITTPTTLAGYDTYTDGTSTVWVKDTGMPDMAHTVTAAAASGSQVAGIPNDITFTVKNTAGAIDTSFTGSHNVTLSGAKVMTSGTGCGFFYSFGIPASGTLTTGVIFTDGVATAPLSLFSAGSQTINFSIEGVTNPSSSVNLIVLPHTPAVMTLTQDITAPVVNGGQFAQQPKLKLTDAYANLCANDSTTKVTASKKDVGDWTLIGNTTVTAENGIVTFTDLGATNTAQVAGAQLTFTANVSINTYTSTAVTLPASTASGNVCKIGEVGYTTLEDALDDVQNNDTITLLQSINYLKPVVIDGETITFGLGSFNLNIDTSAIADSTGLTVRNSGKVSCTGSGKLNVTASRHGVSASAGGEIHVSGNVIARQNGVTTSGSGNPKVTVDGDVTVTGQGISGEVEAISAGAFATVAIGGHVTANRAGDTQVVTAIYSNGSTITVGKNVITQGNGVNVQNGGKITIDGILDFNPIGTGSQSYIKVGTGLEGFKTADDFEGTSTKPGYKEYKNGDNIVWVKGTAQLNKPTGLAWDTSAGQLKAVWNAVPHASQYKVEYYKDGSKLGMSTHVNPPSTATDDIKDNLLVWGTGNYTFTVLATAAAGGSYLDSDVSELSGPYSHTPGGTTYLVTVNGSYALTTGAGSYASGATVDIHAGNRSSYSFIGWTSSDVTITNADNKDASFTMPDKAVTVTASWSYNGNGSSGSPTSSTSTYYADLKEGTGSETTLPVTVNNNNGTASIDISTGKLLSGETVVTMPSIPGVVTYSVGIPVPDLSTSDAQKTLTVQTDNSIVTVPSNMLTGAPGISGSKAQISISQGDMALLSEDVKAAIGNRPLIRLTLSIDGKQTEWSNPGAPVTVSIPYTPTAAELANSEAIVIWYIDGSGNVISIPNGHYDPLTGTVLFTTTHFSYYAVMYNKVSFKDVSAGAWYHKPVSFIAARNITYATGGGNFSPEAKLTRGQFIVMLMKTYNIAPDADPKDNYSDARNTYYTNYLAAAKRLGISNGVGGNMFAPEKEITRQEMFTLLFNALKVIRQLPQGDSGKSLSDFSDEEMIDPWAKNATSFLVKTGIIGGSNGKITPTSTTTRAEMAQVMYNLLGK